MAGQGVPLSCADNDVPHVLEGRIYAGDIQMQGESSVSQQIMLLFGQSSTTVRRCSKLLHSGRGAGANALFRCFF